MMCKNQNVAENIKERKGIKNEEKGWWIGGKVVD
jgi:hypothetical protein